MTLCSAFTHLLRFILHAISHMSLYFTKYHALRLVYNVTQGLVVHRVATGSVHIKMI